jgi:hypothetical protein
MSSNNNTRRPREYEQTDGDIEEAPRLHPGNIKPSAVNEHFSVSARSLCGWDAYIALTLTVANSAGESSSSCQATLLMQASSSFHCGPSFADANTHCNTPCAAWPNAGWDVCPDAESCYPNVTCRRIWIAVRPPRPQWRFANVSLSLWPLPMPTLYYHRLIPCA